MVFFSCESCGGTFKKKQVENHMHQCRFVHVSCLDCSVLFDRVSYKDHLQCVTEEQKYSAKDAVIKEAKGAKKQEGWSEKVQGAIAAANPKNHKLNVLLNQIAEFPNVPRKVAKFKNFLKNSLRIHNEALINEAWDLINSGIAKDDVPADDAEALDGKPVKKQKRKLEEAANSAGENEPETNPSPKKKSKNLQANGELKPLSTLDGLETNGITDDAIEVKVGEFKWSSAIQSVLARKPDKPMKYERLKKKVITEACQSGLDKRFASDSALSAEFDKRLNKSKKFAISGNHVSLNIPPA